MARKPQDNPQLDMTPMIDVVFELIIFFVVTIKQEDMFSKLNCNRPAPATGQATEKDDEEDDELEHDVDHRRHVELRIFLWFSRHFDASATS